MKKFTGLIILLVAVLMTATLGMAAEVEHQSRDVGQLAVLGNVVDHVGTVTLACAPFEQAILHNKDPWSAVTSDYLNVSATEHRSRGKTTAVTQRTRAVRASLKS